MSQRPKREDYEIAIICAKKIESDAVEALFDKDWEEHQQYPRTANDVNEYSMGQIGEHNVVLAFMPGLGKKEATSTATHLRISFPKIQICLVVGICAAVPPDPKSSKEVILGDVMVSTVVVQYDLGRQLPNAFLTKDTLESSLGRPTQMIRAFLEKIKSAKGERNLTTKTIVNLKSLLQQPGFEAWQYPGVENDVLYKNAYRHKHQDPSKCTVCSKCHSKDDKVCEIALKSTCVQLGCDTNTDVLIRRTRLEEHSGRTNPEPVIHFGRVASGDSVMKSSYHRDDLASELDVIALEMEGAGVWDAFPTVVIKGVSDYADSHKDDRWQSYAAAVAASCMKAFVYQWRPTEKASLPEAESGDYSPLSQASTSV